ncbi:hypothetical protein D3C75_687440 [compost metagenome]
MLSRQFVQGNMPDHGFHMMLHIAQEPLICNRLHLGFLHFNPIGKILLYRLFAVLRQNSHVHFVKLLNVRGFSFLTGGKPSCRYPLSSAVRPFAHRNGKLPLVSSLPYMTLHGGISFLYDCIYLILTYYYNNCQYMGLYVLMELRSF